jgi:hypothetical protein
VLPAGERRDHHVNRIRGEKRPPCLRFSPLIAHPTHGDGKRVTRG